MALSFRGGVRLDGKKLTAGAEITPQPAPGFVTIPLLQHLGEACIPCVKVGDRVLKGQKIADSPDEAAPLHASVSGRVLSIDKAVTTLGECDAIVIENDFKEELCPTVKPFSTPISQSEPEALCRHIREKGIVGMGGRAYPTWLKIENAKGKAEMILINCAESEPYLTTDHRILLEKAEEVVGGVKILLRAIGCEKAIFAIENNKEDAVEAIQNVIGGSRNFGLAVFKTKYPQGDERHLIRAITGKEIKEGEHPVDMGVVTFNAETCWAIYRAFVTGLPAIERVVTVSGDCIKSPANLLVPLGVSVASVIQCCGGFSKVPDKILSGGPMMGDEIQDDSVPVTKCVSGVIAVTSPSFRESACIRCGRCVRACPVHLMPFRLYGAVEKSDGAKAAAFSIDACTECGLCTYVCPSRIRILDAIRKGKAVLSHRSEKE